MARALDRFHVLGAGFTQLHAHIDETRCETQPASVDDLGILGKAGIGKPRADRGDPVAFDQEIARRIEPAVGIDEPSISDEPSRGGHCKDGRLLGWLARSSRHAMRTATPAST